MFIGIMGGIYDVVQDALVDQDVIVVYISTPLGNGSAQISLPVIQHFMQARLLSALEMLRTPLQQGPAQCKRLLPARSM